MGIAAASVAAHVIVLTAAALYAPRWRTPPPEPGGPPEPIIPVLITPRVPQASASPGDRPAEIRIHRRPQRFTPEAPPIPPLVLPEPEPPKAAAPAPSGPKVVAQPAQPDALSVNARNALRGRLGCANADALGLSREERQKCEDALASGAKAADFPGLALEPGKAAGLAAAAARKEADYKYKRTGAQATPGGGPSGGGGPGGPDARAIGSMTGNDKPEKVIPF